MSMNNNMNRKIASAFMCALLCTGDITSAALNQPVQVFQANTAAHYQMMQNVLSSDDGYDEFDDDSSEDEYK